MKRIIFVAGIAFLVLAVPAYHYAMHALTSDTVTVKVTDKERVNDDNGSRYMVFSETETFTNTDSWIALKFNSSDVQGNIRIDQTCTFKVDGFRNRFFSWYRNIYELVECK